jgi:hypothetical protein
MTIGSPSTVALRCSVEGIPDGLLDAVELEDPRSPIRTRVVGACGGLTF